MKNQKIFLIIIILVVLFAIFNIFSKKTKTEIVKEEKNINIENIEPTQVVKDHNLKLEIISPVEEKILPRQARMYNAFITGNGKYESAKVNCHWKFYLNENNEEVFYKELENTSILSIEDKEICGFTSTFMEKAGVLRVELTAKISNFAGEELESVSAEKNYIVSK